MEIGTVCASSARLRAVTIDGFEPAELDLARRIPRGLGVAVACAQDGSRSRALVAKRARTRRLQHEIPRRPALLWALPIALGVAEALIGNAVTK